MVTMLNVPFIEKDEAKKIGAKWDGDLKSWVAKNDEPGLVSRWGVKGLKEIIGEDRSFGGNNLYVDLIPNVIKLKNIQFDAVDFKSLSTYVLKRANHQCEICNSNVGLELHERWLFNDNENTVTLKRIIVMCRACHEFTHIGKANHQGRKIDAMEHMMKVSGLEFIRVEEHLEDSYKEWKDRNVYDWVEDTSILSNSGIHLK